MCHSSSSQEYNQSRSWPNLCQRKGWQRMTDSRTTPQNRWTGSWRNYAPRTTSSFAKPAMPTTWRGSCRKARPAIAINKLWDWSGAIRHGRTTTRVSSIPSAVCWIRWYRCRRSTITKLKRTRVPRRTCPSKWNLRWKRAKVTRVLMRGAPTRARHCLTIGPRMFNLWSNWSCRTKSWTTKTKWKS